MPTRPFILPTIVAVAAVLLSCPTASAQSQKQFAALVTPFIKAHCLDCHGAEDPEADVALAGLGSDLSKKPVAGTWAKV